VKLMAFCRLCLLHFFDLARMYVFIKHFNNELILNQYLLDVYFIVATLILSLKSQ